ncbi:MAG: SDR family oxidoreductase [Kiloniellales bacterium]
MTRLAIVTGAARNIGRAIARALAADGGAVLLVAKRDRAGLEETAKLVEAAGGGRIVNIGGKSGHAGAAERAHVIASKAGLVGLTKALAVEFGDRGVTVNCVVPGEIETERGASAGPIPAHPGGHATLIGRRGRPEEVARVVASLCHPDAGYMTGQTVHVNGGGYLP